MKKILLLGVLAISSLANANGFDATKLEKVQVGNKAVPASLVLTEKTSSKADQPMDIQSVLAVRKQMKAAKYDLVDEYYAPGSFHLGVYEGLGAYNMGVILFPYMDSVVYKNTYGYADWSVNGKIVAEASDSCVAHYFINGSYYVPEVADHTFNPAKDWGTGYKDTTFNVKGTKYAIGTSGQYVFSAMESKALGGGSDNAYMTLCGMWTDTVNEPDYGGDDMWMVGGYLTKDEYLNGTGVHLDSAKRDVTADTLGIIVENGGLMKIEQILFPIYNANTTVIDSVIPANAELRVAIFPLKGNSINLRDTIASTVMKQSDFVNAGVTWGTIGTLHAKFYEEDIFHTLTQVPIYVEGDFYLQITNFNESKCNFGIYSDFYNSATGTTVYQQDGKFRFRRSRGGGGQYGQNLAVTFDAYWPTLVTMESTTMEAPVAGGDATPQGATEAGAVFYSNVHPFDWEIDWEDEWLDVAIDTSYYAQYGAGIVYVTAEALPSGVSGRTATVEVNADGNVQVLTIVQGESSQGVENTKVNAVFENKSYDLLGREIKDEKLFKGSVIIRNGKKTLSK